LCAGEFVNQNLFLELDGVVVITVSGILRPEVGSDHILVL